MSGGSKFSALRWLLDDSIRPYLREHEEEGTEGVAVVISLTKDNEKDVLIALSQVLGQVQLWTRSLQDISPRNEEDRECLAHILANSVLLVGVENQYVQHLVGNLLVAISDLAAASGLDDWDSFISLLCFFLEFAIANVLSPCSPSRLEKGDWGLRCDSSSLVVLNSRLKAANWFTVAGITRVLRNVLKYLKQEGDDLGLLQLYFTHFYSFLSNVMWDSMDEIFVSQTSESSDSLDTDTLSFNVPEEEMKIDFLGNFVQLLCSLVEQSNDVEGDVGSDDQQPVLGVVVGLVPKLFSWCLGERAPCAKMSITHYFRHKLLMLMLRLSYQTPLGSSTLVSWLPLLHNYFEELLRKPIIELESDQDESLYDSPFSFSGYVGELQSMNSLHLQRQVVLLFLRCCFSLINNTGETGEECAFVALSSSLNFASLSDLNSSGRKAGFLDFYKWSQIQVHFSEHMDQKLYFRSCIQFAMSFLQLYMHEDDLLFKALLQLFTAPSCVEQQLNGDACSSQNVNEDICSHVANIFNPVNLFHLFLAKLHYDHQVLLDYLISKDTGISCAEYLLRPNIVERQKPIHVTKALVMMLRSLRVICDSWNIFSKFSMDGEVTDLPPHKKRKITLDSVDFQARPLSVNVKGTPSSFGKEPKGDLEYGHEHYKTKTEPFKEAKRCLLSLKDSVENLHQKKLFPYNPDVLLKRLTKFQQLCFK